MGKHKNYASGWQQAGRNARAKAKPDPTGEVDLGDGLVFLGRRLNMAHWVKGGRIPQFLTEQFIRIGKGAQADIDEASLTAEQVIQANRFQRDLVLNSVVLPVIVEDDKFHLEADEIRWADAFCDNPDWPDRIALWQVQGADGIPVQMANGEVIELPELETFHDGEQADVGGGADGEAFGDTPQQVDRVIG